MVTKKDTSDGKNISSFSMTRTNLVKSTEKDGNNSGSDGGPQFPAVALEAAGSGALKAYHDSVSETWKRNENMLQL